MTTGSGMSLNIDDNLVRPVVEKEIEAAIVRELEKSDQLIPKLIRSVLYQKVDYEGRPSNYSSDKNRTYLDYTFEQAIKSATKAAINTWVENYKDEFESLLEKEIRSPKSGLSKSILEAFTKTVTDHWRFTVNVEVKS